MEHPKPALIKTTLADSKNMIPWDASCYMQFGDERTRPSVDLVSRIAVSNPKTIMDIGCGPGNSTEVLRHRWPAAQVSGLDSSPEMIAAARNNFPDQEWILASAERWLPLEPLDVVFSNAALQWIPNHDILVRHLFEQISTGGALAFQLPSGAYSPLRAFIHEIAAHPDWSARMQQPLIELTMETPSYYYDVLTERARLLDIWETEYTHVMDSPISIIDWISSTGLRPFLNPLHSNKERERFIAMLTERVMEKYSCQRDGRVLFPFKRLFVVAYR